MLGGRQKAKSRQSRNLRTHPDLQGKGRSSHVKYTFLRGWG